MARITHVKSARQRYAQVPIRDADGKRVETPVTDSNGVQKTTKSGRPIFQRPTRNDTDRPLPMPTCDSCHKPIEVGQPYKHISPKSGPYGGRTLNRHGHCPDWNVWDYSSSLSARIAQIQHDGWQTFDATTFESTDDVTSALSEVAEEIRSLAEEKRESAGNIEDGFGHATSASDELNEQADTLDGWADDVENADVPDLPEPEETDCDQCGGSGKDTCSACDGDEDAECEDCGGSGEEDCGECDGTGTVTAEEPTDEQMDEWRDEVRDALSVLDDCPL